MLTAQNQKEATELLSGRIPPDWTSRWEGPDDPNEWLRVINKKATALIGWVQRVQQRQLLEHPVCLSDLIHPQTFLNALRQRSARRLQIAIDELKLVSTLEKRKLGDTSVQLEGLWLQGSDFNGKALSDCCHGSHADGAVASELLPLPVCTIAWIGRKEADPYPESATASIPVYHALDREELLCTMAIPTEGARASRILSGAALFLDGQ
jgi:dynein heavy chain 2